ncbi:MAG: DNA polymerase III subunit alpha [Thermomicrobiales bacterium]
MNEFAHLHLHTEYSLLDGMGRIPEYIDQAKSSGLHHLAVTDHGVMYAAMDFYKAATKAGLHPIIGMEAYLSEGPVAKRERKSYHLLLLAENEVGYRNLLSLATRSNLEGYYYRPRIDFDMLATHSEGLIGTSACLGGPVANHFLHGQPAKARQNAGRLAEIFAPGRFFIEIQDHGLREQVETNRELITLARAMDLPLVATNDVHYCVQDDSPAQDLLICVQTNTTLSDPKRLKTDSDQFYLKSADEMARVFGELPEALSNTIAIAEMCHLDLGFTGYHLPHFDVPDGFDADGYLEHLCLAGARQRYGHTDGAVGERLAYELRVIREMGFTTYFLVVWDFVRFAKENGILVGPGRGSAAGSIVCYSLDVTALDPLKYDLIFERFLNPDRISMPDIDIDFADDRRDEVIAYVVAKYGDDRVAQIATFGTMAAKAAVRDVGRAMGRTFAETDRVAKLIPVGPGITIDGAMGRVPEFQKLYDADASVKELVDAAKKVEGIARHASTHAAGVVISRDPLIQHVPLQHAGGKSDGDITTQYPMSQLEDLGLLKMDFLGLKTLSVLGRAIELVNRDGHGLDLETIPLDDEESYALLRRGETVGIFQLEGGMTTRMTTDVAPTCFEDLIALMALIRPGPMELAPDYIARKHGREPIEYMHPSMEPVLGETYGIALYQEQVMRQANVLAGFTMAEGDGLRKAMGKKLPAEMAKYRERFVTGCSDNSINGSLAGKIWDLIERFAGYGFNKAHSAAYAVIAAQTAYFKARHPVEFMAALLTTDIGNPDKIVSDFAECRRAGITVLPPRVNASDLGFTVERQADGTKAVRFGLLAIKNAGEAALRGILDVRQGQRDAIFTTLDDFCDAIDWTRVSRRVVECLAKAGAMDEFGPRADVLGALDRAMEAGQRRHKAASRGQIGLFEFTPQAVPVAAAPAGTSLVIPAGPVVVSREHLTWEKELLGLYLSDHPLNAVLGQGMQVAPGTTTVAAINEREGPGPVKVIGMIAAVRRVTTKANKTMAIVTLEDLTGSIELVAFPECYDRHLELWVEDAVIEVQAKAERRGEQWQLVCDQASLTITSSRARPRSRGTMRITLPGRDEWWSDGAGIHSLLDLLGHHEGEDELVFEIPLRRGMVAVRSRSRRVEAGGSLGRAVDRLLGPGSATWTAAGAETGGEHEAERVREESPYAMAS